MAFDRTFRFKHELYREGVQEVLPLQARSVTNTVLIILQDTGICSMTVLVTDIDSSRKIEPHFHYITPDELVGRDFLGAPLIEVPSAPVYLLGHGGQSSQITKITGTVLDDGMGMGTDRTQTTIWKRRLRTFTASTALLPRRRCWRVVAL